MAELIVDTSHNDETSPRIIHDAVDMLDGLLKDFDGKFKVTVLDQIKMRGDVRLRLGNAIGQRLVVKVKPGDNTTAREWGITPPAPLTAQSLYRMLKDKTVPNGDGPPNAEDHVDNMRPLVDVSKLPPLDVIQATNAKAYATNAKAYATTLTERIAELQAASAAYDDRIQQIAGMERQVEEIMAKIEAVQREQEEDYAGKQAGALLAELRRVAGI